MRLILDTHAYAWWATGDGRLAATARDLIEAAETELFLSAVVVWELATKNRVGKWPGADKILADLRTAIVAKRLTPLPINLDHARRAGLLAGAHRDPFDRMLAAQSEIEAAALVTADPASAGFGTETIW